MMVSENDEINKISMNKNGENSKKENISKLGDIRFQNLSQHSNEYLINTFNCNKKLIETLKKELYISFGENNSILEEISKRIIDSKNENSKNNYQKVDLNKENLKILIDTYEKSFEDIKSFFKISIENQNSKIIIIENKSEIYSNDYKIDKVYFERNEVEEKNKIFKRCLYNQTKIISELKHEIIKKSNVSKDNKIISTSLNIGIEPIRFICNKYRDELNKGIKELEKLLIFSKQNSNENILNETINPWFDEISNIQDICSSTLFLLNNINIESLNNIDSNKYNISLLNITDMNSKLQHLLAKTCCDESFV